MVCVCVGVGCGVGWGGGGGGGRNKTRPRPPTTACAAQPARSVDTLTVAELHALKTGGSNRALSSRAIAALYEKPHQLTVQVIGKQLRLPACWPNLYQSSCSWSS